MNPDPPPAPDQSIVEEHNQEEDRVQVEEIADPLPSPPLASPPPPASKPPAYDINRLPYDPGEKLPLKIILLMIKMQFVEHILLKVLANLIYMIFHTETLEAYLVDSVYNGCIIMSGSNIVSRRILHFASYATCSRRAVGQKLLLLMDGIIGI